MKLCVEYLDPAFGLVPVGVWKNRLPDASRVIGSGENAYAVDREWIMCARCIRLEPVDEEYAFVGKVYHTDGAEGPYFVDDVSDTCSYVSVALGAPPEKLTTRSRKFAIAFYQALFERLLVSRLISGDRADERLQNIIREEQSPYIISPLNGLRYEHVCGFPDCFICSHVAAPLLDADTREKAGALCGKISDGVAARAAIETVNSFLANVAARYDNDSINRLYPPTPTKSADGRLPEFGSGVFVTDTWFNKDHFCSEVWRTNCRAKQRDELRAKVLPAFGAREFGNYHTDSWLVDMTMRKLAAHAGLHALSEDSLAPFFRDILEAAYGAILDSRDLNGIVDAFVSCQTRTDLGDPSGDFAATCNDSCGESGASFADQLKCHNSATLTSRKMSAVSLGYAATVLGSFGQNAVSFGNPDLRYKFFERTVSGQKGVIYIPVFGILDSCGEVGLPYPSGYNPMTETLDWGFSACTPFRIALFKTCCSPSIGVHAHVSGYGGALPWFGGDVILYPGPDALDDCVWCGLECRVVSINELLRATVHEGGPTTYCDYYWRLRHELPYERGYSDVSFCFSWTCNDCKLPVSTCRCYKYSCVYSTLYPARSVLTSKLIELVRDIHAYFVILDSATKLTTDFHGVDQRGFHTDCLAPRAIREFIEKCDNPLCAPFHYLDNLVRKLLSKADAYVKSECQLHIRSLGYSQFRSSRQRGCDIDCVIHPTKFPITCADLFEGSDALIDPRDEDELTAEINKDCNILTCGYWPEAVHFGLRGTVTGLVMRNVKSRERVCIDNVQSVSFRCSSSGRIYHGWKVGRLQRTGNHGVWRCKYEPYALAVEHRIELGAAFGVVRWDYKIMSRV